MILITFIHILRWNSGKLAEEANNIPYQLQKLFLLLQTSEKSSLETKELTASFGWESNETYDQHDVQEVHSSLLNQIKLL